MNWTSHNSVEFGGVRYGQKDEEFRAVHRPARRWSRQRRSSWRWARARTSPRRAPCSQHKGWQPGRPERGLPGPRQLPHLHRDLDGRVGRRQERLRARAVRLVQRALRALPRRGSSGRRAGDGLQRRAPDRRGDHPVHARSTRRRAAIREVERNYDRHSRAARAIAEEYFDSDKVLTRAGRGGDELAGEARPSGCASSCSATSCAGRSAGYAWHHLQYVGGLAALGHDVCLRRGQRRLSGLLRPGLDVTGDDPTYGLASRRRLRSASACSERWAYHDAHTGTWHGPPRADAAVGDLPRARTSCSTSPARTRFAVLARDSGACADRHRPGLHPVRHLVPSSARAPSSTPRSSRSRRTSARARRLPDDGLPWRPTRQPVVLDLAGPAAARGPFTTVMQWESYPAASTPAAPTG